MNTPVDKAILRRIAKMLHRAERTDSTHEAATAVALATALMERHNLDRATVEAQGGESSREPAGLETLMHLNNRPAWVGSLGSAIAHVNNCKVYWHEVADRKYELRVVGTQTDRAAVKMMFDFLRVEVTRLAKDALKKRTVESDDLCDMNPTIDDPHEIEGGRKRGSCVYCGRYLEDDRDGPRTYANNFRLGAVDVLRKRLQEAAEERAAKGFAPDLTPGDGLAERDPEEPIITPPPPPEVQEKALVLLSRNRAEVDAFYRDLSEQHGIGPIKRSPTKFSHTAREAGREAGGKIHLGGQLSARAGTKGQA